MLKFACFAAYTVTVLVRLCLTEEIQASSDVTKSLKSSALTITKTLKILTGDRIFNSQKSIVGSSYKLTCSAKTIKLTKIIIAISSQMIPLIASVKKSDPSYSLLILLVS